MYLCMINLYEILQDCAFKQDESDYWKCTEYPLAPRGSAEAHDEELPVAFESANMQKRMGEIWKT